MLSNIAYGIGIDSALAAVLGVAQHRTRAQEISQYTALVGDTAEKMDLSARSIRRRSILHGRSQNRQR